MSSEDKIIHPRVLIVGTVPYNKRSTSRAFEAYFHGWEKENLAQVFSNTRTPCKGHCGTLFQITDHRLLKRRFNKKTDTGKIFRYEDLPDEWVDNDLEIKSDSVKKMYKIGARHTPLTHLIRKAIWKKKFWCTEKFNKWLDEFNPECVFLSFSDDFFIPEIALYVAKKFDIPIVSSIGDDYYFNERFSLSPFYLLYKKSYKRLIRKVLAYKGSAIYISDKIRDKYNSEFGLNGKTVYLTSEIKRKEFKPINKNNPIITYFGNIRMGRNDSLNEIGYALGGINKDYRIEVYSGENDDKYYKVFGKNPFIKYCGAVPYSEVVKKMSESDITVIVEGFKKKDIDQSRYSLSTKAADALASGVAILSYGSDECGIIEYLKSTGASVVCSDKKELGGKIYELINDEELQKKQYDNAVKMTKEHHNLCVSCKVFESVVKDATDKGKSK